MEVLTRCRHCGGALENLGNAAEAHWVHVSDDPRAPIGSAQCVGDAWGELAEPSAFAVGSYRVLPDGAVWRVMESFGSYRMLKKKFRTAEQAAARAEGMAK